MLKVCILRCGRLYANVLQGATMWTRDGRVYAVFGTHELVSHVCAIQRVAT